MPATMPPEIRARFALDAAGNPQFEFVEEDQKKHYKLMLEVENLPADVYAATFELDPTYYDPVQTVRPDDQGRVRLETTSYGDYRLKVRLRTKEGEIQVVDSLVGALRRSQPDMPANPAIVQAIAEIQTH